MSEYIALDSHKRYSWVEREEVETGRVRQCRLLHARGSISEFLKACAPGTPVAIEATANWYWIIDEIEQARCVPRLTHARKAKLMMGQINKTDKLDAHGMNVLQRNGTLPTVWIPPGPLRELRELTRTRVVLVAQRTRWKNRITATLAKWGVPASEYSDPYGKSAREELEQRLAELPEQTRWATQQMLAQLDALSEQIRQFEKRLEELVEITPEMQLFRNHAGSGRDFGGNDRAGDWRHWALCERRAAGFLQRHHAARAFQRRSHALRTNAAGCEPLFEMGVCGSRELRGGELPSLPGAACQPALRAIAGAQRPRQGRGRGGAPFGRGGVSRLEPQAGLSRSDNGNGSDQRGVNANLS